MMIPRLMRPIVAVATLSLTLILFGDLSKASTAWMIPAYFAGDGAWCASTTHRPIAITCHHPQAFAFLARRGENRRVNQNYQGQQERYKAASSPSLSDQADEEVVKGITLKIAVDSQGAAADLAADKSERFTCAESLDMVHRLRAVSDAVLVGKSTVLVDNPSLTVRRCPLVNQKKEQPIRVVLDPTLSLLKNETVRKTFHLFRPSTGRSVNEASPPRTILFYANDVNDDTELILAKLPDHVACLAVPRTPEDGLLSIPSVLDALSRLFHVQHIMVEGGPATAKQFLPFVGRCLLVRAIDVRFKEPLDAGLSRHVLEEAGLQYLGTRKSGADEIDYWSRRSGNSSKDASWPTVDLSDWP